MEKPLLPSPIRRGKSTYLVATVVQDDAVIVRRQQDGLLRNNGNWIFEDVTTVSGLNEHNTRFSFAAAWEDFYNDGDLDLYVANDFGRNCLYQWDQQQRRFSDVAAAAGVEDISAGGESRGATTIRTG